MANKDSDRLSHTVTVGQASQTGTYVNLTAQIDVSGSKATVTTTLSGLVRSTSAFYANNDLGNYRVFIDGKFAGGADADGISCTVTVGSSSQTPTPSPTTTHLGVTG